LGLDLQRKRPLSDLTPEDEAQEAPPSPTAVGDVALVVEETPSFERTTSTIDNSDSACHK
jgi:hypothetical protein